MSSISLRLVYPPSFVTLYPVSQLSDVFQCRIFHPSLLHCHCIRFPGQPYRRGQCCLGRAGHRPDLPPHGCAPRRGGSGGAQEEGELPAEAAAPPPLQSSPPRRLPPGSSGRDSLPYRWDNVLFQQFISIMGIISFDICRGLCKE